MRSKKRFSKKWMVVLGILAAVMIGIQFIKPRLGTATMVADIAAPPEVEQVLKKSCYNCHSDSTRLAWFDKIAPASWLVGSHIKKGRTALNFSEWGELTKDQQKAKLFESLNQMVFGDMPLRSYSLFHPESKVTAGDITVLRNYLASLVPPEHTDTAKDNAALRQYEQWIKASSTTAPVQPALDGIAWMPEYKNWQAITSSERFDNGTMRVIMGNPVAINAIKTGHTNPWPDGSIFAKIAWDKLSDTAGNVRAGAFKQVEFMIKDAQKYATSDGWGFARWWKGTRLVPYGKDALFVDECTGCHQPMKANDFVFTPVDSLHSTAAFSPAGLSFNPLEWNVITSSINKRNHTMSILYGNAIALQSARTGSGHGYSTGAVLALVTWQQQEDPHWYGANLPDAIKCVERLTFNITVKNTAQPVYEKFEGASLQKAAEVNTDTIKSRMAFIVNQNASLMP
ncbi:MAG TPA: cytochrome P460 family protein [Chitinophagaceae bacterium]|jgi:hypothetical protein